MVDAINDMYGSDAMYYGVDSNAIGHYLYDAGYRKQSVGVWKVFPDEHEICASEFVCSVCKESFVTSEMTDEQFYQMMKYCPECGAKMDGKGGEE